LNNRRETTPGKRCKGPTERSTEFPIIETFELDSKEAGMGRVERQGPECGFNVSDRSPGVLVSTSENVSNGSHFEMRSGMRGGVRRMAKRGRGVGDKPKFAWLTRFRDEGNRDDPSGSGSVTNFSAEEVTGSNFRIEIISESRSIFGGARVIGEMEVLNDGIGGGNIQTVSEHGGNPVAFRLGGVELL
jgi:hypothetical protein